MTVFMATFVGFGTFWLVSYFAWRASRKPTLKNAPVLNMVVMPLLISHLTTALFTIYLFNL